MSLIIEAIKEGRLELAESLIEHALPYQLHQRDENGQTALHLTVIRNLHRMTSMLLIRGAEVNATAHDAFYTYMTPLHYAALNNNLEAAKILIAWGADLNAENGQLLTPCQLAKKKNSVEVAKLIENNFDHANHEFIRPTTMMPNKDTHLKRSLKRKLLELKVSSFDTLEARSDLDRCHRKPDNVVDLAKFRKSRHRGKS